MNQKPDSQPGASSPLQNSKAGGQSAREPPRPAAPLGLQNALETSESGSKNYFVMNHFKSRKQKAKQPPKTVPEGEAGQSQSPKQGGRIPDLTSARPQDDLPPHLRTDPQLTLNLAEPSKPVLALVEIREMFRNPKMDTYCAKPSGRVSEGSRSQNFRLSNILSIDLSNSEIQNSKLKLSSDLSESLLKVSKVAEKEPSRQATGDRASPVLEVKNLLGEKALAQNLSLPLKRKQNSGHFEVETKKKSQSREKKLPKTARPDEMGANSANSSMSDEHLCKAFSVDKSCINSRKLDKSSRPEESFEDEQRVALNMEAEEKRTLSLIHDEPEEMDRVSSLQKQPAPKSRLQYKNKVFELQSKKDPPKELSASMEVPPSPMQSMSFSGYQLRKPALIGGAFKESSMFSTQDSKPSKHNNSLNADIYGAADQKLSLAPLECGPNIQIQTHFGIPQFLDPMAMAGEESGYYDEESDFFPTGDGEKCQASLLDYQVGPGLLGQRRTRRTSARKSHPISNPSEYIIDINNVDPRKTTAMIRNIPNRYTKEMMMDMFDKDFDNGYNFFYLPIDHEKNANFGYAFINFHDHLVLRAFYLTFHGKKWPVFNSEKVCEISYARIQGLEACNEHFKNSSLMKQPVG